MFRIAVLVLTIVLAAQGSAQKAGLTKEYRITALGRLHPNGYSYAGDLNTLGEVTGTGLAANGQSEHAWVYRNGTITDLGTLGSTYSWGFSINDATTIVGYSSVHVLLLQAYRWSNGTMSAEDPGGYNYSRANAVNQLGDVVGILNGFFDPVIQTTLRGYATIGGTTTVLDTFGGNESRGHDINDHGQVTGIARDIDGRIRGFLFDSGAMVDLGDLGDGYCWPKDINDRAEIVGVSRLAGGIYRGFHHDGVNMIDLGTLGGVESDARGINKRGEVVGQAEDTHGRKRAFHWQNGVMRDLNRLIRPAPGWVLTGATAVNDLGQIAGTGKLRGVRRAYLLTPIGDELRYSGAVPGLAGTTATCHAAGAEPGSLLTFVFGTQAGSSPVSGCSGVSVDIANPSSVGSAVVDANGRATLVVALPASWSGITVRSQAVDTTHCRVSPVSIQTL